MQSPDIPARAEQLEIDASTRWPFTAFLVSALFWLLAGGVLQLASAIQLHTPDFLAGCAWFTHGRLAAASQHILVYGWGFCAGFAVALWLMARLSAAALRHGGWLLVAAKFWNIAVLLAAAGILGGGATSYELLEMPRYVTGLMLVAYALIAVWAVTTFSVRNTESVYASQWWVLVAAFAFPWLFAIAQGLLFCLPVHGTVQAVVSAWYVGGIMNFWFIPLTLAILYYFLPKLTGTPIRYYYLAPLAFWWFLACAGFAGASRLIGGPVPAWVPTLGSVANFLLTIAVFIMAVNFLGGLRARLAHLNSGVSLRFLLLAITAFLLAAVLAFALSIRGFAVKAQFTQLASLHDWLVVQGAFTSAIAAAAYFIVPRITGKAWRSAALVRTHLGATIVGLVLVSIAYAASGWTHGDLLSQANVSYAEILKELRPWFLLTTAGLGVLVIGHLSFLLNFVLTACPCCGASCPAAIISAPPSMEASQA